MSDGFKLGDAGQPGRAPDWGPGDPKNYDEKGRYVYGGNSGNIKGGGSGCIGALVVLAAGTVSAGISGLMNILDSV